MKESFYCPFCKRMVISSKFSQKWGSGICALCSSRGRHRALYHIYSEYFLNTKKNIKLLHFAPEISIYREIKKNNNIKYSCCDYNIDIYKQIPEIVRQDGMNTTYPDEYFDLIIHNHVLEHVENDKLFIKECLRILKKDGIILFSFPYYPNDTNLEIKTNSAEERIKLYGNFDHLRRYGYNWKEKFDDGDYKITELKLLDFIDENQIEKENIHSSSIYAKIEKYNKQ